MASTSLQFALADRNTLFTQREQWRLSTALLISAVFHALLLSVAIGGQTFGLPGLTFPWKEKRLGANDLQVMLAPLPLPALSPELPPALPPAPVALSSAVLASTQPPAPSAIASAPPSASTMTAVVRPDVNLPIAPNAPQVRPRAVPLEEIPATAANDSPALPSEDIVAQRHLEQETREQERALEQAKLDRLNAERQRQAAAEAQKKAELLVARQEVARNEAARLEAERQQIARQDELRKEAQQQAELAKARQETTRMEQERTEAARLEVARLEAVRLEAVRQEAARKEAARLELAKQEQAKQELARQDLAKQELTKQAQLEAARQAQLQQEAARQEVARQEALRQEATRQATAKQEALQHEAARQEAAQNDAARNEAARQEAARLEKAELAKREKAEYEAKREERLRAIGRQLNEEAAQRDAATRPSQSLLPGVSGLRRGWLFGRADPNADLVQYAEAMSKKIEMNMTFDMVREVVKRPHAAPSVTVAVRADGSVEKITFTVSSGVPAIDDAIRRVVASQAPYGVFPPALGRQYDVIEIRRTWTFDTAIRLQ